MGFLRPRTNPIPIPAFPLKGKEKKHDLPLTGRRTARPSREGKERFPAAPATPGATMKSRHAILPLALLVALPSLAGTRGFDVRDMVRLDRYSSPTLSPDGRKLV